MKIAIASGKGGTGKTTLSTNLASFLAENNNVVLVDLDVEEPNSGLFLKSELVVHLFNIFGRRNFENHFLGVGFLKNPHKILNKCHVISFP